MGGYTEREELYELAEVVICLQISNFEWVDTPIADKLQEAECCDLLTK